MTKDQIKRAAALLKIRKDAEACCGRLDNAVRNNERLLMMFGTVDKDEGTIFCEVEVCADFALEMAALTRSKADEDLKAMGVTE